MVKLDNPFLPIVAYVQVLIQPMVEKLRLPEEEENMNETNATLNNTYTFV